MNEIRKTDLWNQLRKDFRIQNLGPGDTIPAKTMEIRAYKLKILDPDELGELLVWVVNSGFLTYARNRRDGIYTLTDAGYLETLR